MLINLTPHAVTLRDEYGQDIIIPPDGTVARVMPLPGEGGVWFLPGIPNVPVYTPDRPGRVTGLPDPMPEVYYVVSALVGAAVAGKRGDVLVLGTGPNDNPVRDDAGRIVAVTCLKMV